MLRNSVTKVLVLIFVAVLFLGNFSGIELPGMASDESSTDERYVSRMLNVVYDDSNSMLLNDRLWWCYAKYSLEVFSSMLQDRDTMNVYYMSDGDDAPRISNLSGNRNQQQQNISKIHNTVTRTGGTPFESIEKAYSDLKKTSGSYDEKWLMVITDGDSFNDDETSDDLDELFSTSRDYGIKVVYLAIGNALVPTASDYDGIYVYKADGQATSGDTGILSRVTQICQKIFQRPVLGKTGDGKVKIDIPVSEIIVFAQGANVSTGEISGTTKSVANVSMKQSDKDKATTNGSYKDKISIATLSASVVTYVPNSSDFIKEGTYDLNIKADEYAVYYKPCLDVILKLIDSKGNLMVDKYIPIGSYTVDYWLTYPEGHSKHGEKISQSLFDVDYTVTCTTNGSTRELNSNSADLAEGDTIIGVRADYLNFSSSYASFKCVVEDFTINEVEIELEYLQKEYRLSTLEEDNEGIRVIASQNGSPLPASDWERFTLKCDIENLDFEIIKNSDSTFMIYPRYKNGERSQTATGDIDFNVVVSASNDHRPTDSGTLKANINIYDDVSAANIGITIDKQPGKCDNKNFDNQETSRKVTIDWNGNLLTKEQYDALQLSVKVDDKYYEAKIELDPYAEGEPTTATVFFNVKKDADGNLPKPKKLDGSKEFTVSAVVEHEGEKSTGSEKAKIKVDDARTCCEKFKDLLPILLPFLIILVLILFYAPIIKRYLPWRCSTRTETIYLYKGLGAILTTLVPFMDVRRRRLRVEATGVGKMTLRIKASSGTDVVCLNTDDLSKTYCIMEGNNARTIDSSQPLDISLNSTKFSLKNKREKAVVEFIDQ